MTCGDGRAIGVPVRKALLELGGVILAQQINPLTQKTPIGEAEHCLSNYRGSLHFLDALIKTRGYAADKDWLRNSSGVSPFSFACLLRVFQWTM